MNKKEAAEYLGVSTRAIERYTKQGKLSVKYENLVEFLERKLGAESIFSNEPPERLREIVKASQAEMG